MKRAFRDDHGELYATFECPEGHEFDLGPVHDPSASEPDPENPTGMRSVPGSGRSEHVPDQTPCRVCAERAGALSVGVIARLPLASRA
jgi:hypothetical protein